MVKFRVASVQLNVGNDISHIVRDVKRYIKLAKKERVDIVCFPEDTIYAGPKKNIKILEQIKKSCKENKIWCIITEHLKERKYSYNSAVIIDNKGKTCGKHKKVHTCDYNVRAGSRFDVYDLPFCKAGIAICWDISHPDTIYSMVKKGAKIIFCPMFWEYDEWAHKKNHKKYEKKLLESLILTRAFESLVYVVFCNPYHPHLKELVSYSAIAEPERVIKDIYKREGMIYADIDLNHLEELRKNYKKDYNKLVSSPEY